MSSWFLNIQIQGLRGKMEAIIADWKSLERSISDEERNDFNAMTDALWEAANIVDLRAYNVVHNKNTEDARK